ncbi:MAG: glycosyltransferase [Novosphingobium sp.]|uniref:glycosyltransferase n=1 Tax=Novosphingobium sp. TaxID=1874826 RepID=UPI003C7E54B1
MTPWLTVIIPVHNGAPLLDAALAGIAAENPEGVEVLILNSAEDDGAARRISDSYADRIAIVWHDRPDLPNWTYKANAAAQLAHAPHISVLCHDDFWLPGHLDSIRRSLARHPDAVMSVAPARFAGPDGKLLGPWGLPFAPGLVSGQEFGSAMLVQNTVAVNGAVLQRDAYLQAGGFDEALWYTADWDLYLKLARIGAVDVRPEVTTAYRVHGNAQTLTASRDIAEFRRQLDEVIDRHLLAFTSAHSAVDRRVRASVEVNCALALAASGKRTSLLRTLLHLLRLGPRQILRFFDETRLIDRLRPRLRLALTGGL